MKKILASLFGVAMLAGLTLSFANLKSVKSLMIQNVDALSVQAYYSYWNGIPLEGDADNSGSCGLVYIDPYSGRYQYYCWTTAAEKNRIYQNYRGQAWCCSSCSNTTYCGGVLPRH